MASIAIFGLNGTLGKPTLEALKSDTFASKVKFPIIAVTRDASKQTSDKYVKYVTGDYTDGGEKIIEELKGVDAIVELFSPSPETNAVLEKVAAAVKPKVYIPTQFGCILEDSDKTFPGFLGIKAVHSDNIRKISGVKVIDIYTGFFSSGAYLREVIGLVGADTQNKSVTYFVDPELKFSHSSLEDIGKVIASVVTNPKASELPDKLNVNSGYTTPAEVVKTYEDSHNVKLEVKTTVPKDEVVKAAKSEWSTNGFQPAKFFYYLQVLASLGPGGGVTAVKSDNELVNPGESLWKWSTY